MKGDIMKKSLLLLSIMYGLTNSTYSNADSKNQRELDCLTSNIYYEAGGESFEGKLAVAQVTMNRVGKPGFGKTICGVVNQRVGRACQFSWVCQRHNKMNDKERYSESKKAAIHALSGHELPKMKQAMYFHERRARPGWHLASLGRIGNHIFYKSPKTTPKRS